jgi:hypothetical protein
MHRPNEIRGALLALLPLAAATLLAAAAGPAVAGVQVAILPGTTNVAPGGEFDVTIGVTQAGSAFNAFRCTVAYDTTALTFVPATWLSQQEGSLMTGACGLTFHQFAASHDSLLIYDSILCDQISLTGPGTIYKLHFKAKSTPTVTWIRLLKATFLNAGLYVTPVTTADARVGIGILLDAGGPLAPARGLSVTAEPNPARGRLSLAVESDRAGSARLEVFDLAGRLVRRFEPFWREAGTSRVTWDGTDASGAHVRPGVYLVTARTDGRVARTRVAILE